MFKSSRATLFAMVAGALAVGSVVGNGVEPTASADVGERPNVVLIYTDDQRVDEMRFMPKTQALIGERGVTFPNSYVSLSLCCPARAAIVTGQHATNNGVWANTGEIGGYAKHDADRALPVWLDNAGYTTVHIGKTMHGTGQTIPPGWDDWQTPRRSDSKMFDWTLADNGTLVDYGRADDDYQTDVYARRAALAIEDYADGPFFMKISTSAPHVGGGGTPPTPAPRHKGTVTEPLPRSPSFNISESGATLSSYEISKLQRLFRARAESLKAVDDLVETVVVALEAQGILDNTIIVFTSDNGYLLGEHAESGKVIFYEESIAVPLLIRGPGFPAGTISDAPVQNIDYPVTFADVAQATPLVPVDGLSILDLMADDRQDRSLFIMSSRTTRNSTAWWTGIRTRRFTYIRRANGEEKLYDSVTDPHQLENLGRSDDYAPVRAYLADQLDQFETCTASTCDKNIDDNRLIELIGGDVDPGGGGTGGDTGTSVEGVGTAPSASAVASEASIRLDWSAVARAERYRVRIRTGSGSWQPIEQVGTSLSHVFDGLSSSTGYTVAVSSRVGGKWRNEWSAITIATQDPGGGTTGGDTGGTTGGDTDGTTGGDTGGTTGGTDTGELVVPGTSTAPTMRLDISDDSIDVRWDPIDTAVRYQFRFKRNSLRWSWDTPTTETSRALRNLNEDDAYTIEVRALIDRVWNEWNSVVVIPAAGA